MLNDSDLLHALRRHWDHSGVDEDVAHEIYHDDAVLEFPQSGERFEGVWMFTVNFLEFRDDRVAHERIYIMDGWAAAEWRKPWRAEQPADPPPPAP